MTDPGSIQPPPPGPPPGPGDPYGSPSGPYGGPPAAAPEPLPWEDRSRRGFFPALVDTLKLLITSPTEAYQRARESGDYASPLIFGLLMIVIGTLLATFWGALISLVMPAPDLTALQDLPPNIRPLFERMADTTPASMAFQALLNLVLYFVGLFLLAAIVHLCLLMVRGTAQSRSGFEGTFRTLGYATAANVALAVPFVGIVIAWVWYLILVILGLAVLHRTSHGKSAAAALLPLVLCCVCAVIGIVLAASSIAAALGGMQ